MRISAFRASAIADSTPSSGISISRSEHSQQGGTTARARRFAPTTHAGDSARPFKSGMQRCGRLGLRFTHRIKTPHGQKRDHGLSGRRSTTPFEQRGTPVPPGIAVLASISQTQRQCQPTGPALWLAQLGPDFSGLSRLRVTPCNPDPLQLGPFVIGQETHSN
jgi:hypothetical protein